MEMMGKMENQIELRFNGADYQPSRDNPRLTKQILRVWECMKDSQWRTLSEIAAITGDPEASVSAQLRHLRKERFGGHIVDRRYLKDGLYQYKLTPSGNK
jgi:hypothetical protein